MNIGTQIKDMLNNSKHTDANMLDILERADDKYGMLKEIMRPSNIVVEEVRKIALPRSSIDASYFPIGEAASQPKQDVRLVPEVRGENTDRIGNNERN